MSQIVDFSTTVNWPANKPATDSGWRWQDLPDLFGPTVIPGGEAGPRVPSTGIPDWMTPDLSANAPASGSGGFFTTGGIDIGLPGFGLGPDIDIPYPGREKLAANTRFWLLVAAGLIGAVIIARKL